MKLQSLLGFLSVLNIFSDSPQHAKKSTNFRIVLNEVRKLVDLSDCPKYIFWVPRTFKKFYELQNNFEWRFKAFGPSWLRSQLGLIFQMMFPLHQCQQVGFFSDVGNFWSSSTSSFEILTWFGMVICHQTAQLKLLHHKAQQYFGHLAQT